jgi:DNA-binding response OmpR family regulator
MKILIIEDEKSLMETMVSYLKEIGYLCETAINFAQAESKINDYRYDCIIVDLMLPDGSGLDLVKQIKETDTNTSIIIISAKGALEDKIIGLDAGSDDYLTKPFHLSELNARIKSVIRRRSFGGNTEVKFNEIKIMPDSREVYINQTSINLTGKEYDLLLFFIANKGRVVTKDSLVEHLWGDGMDQSDSYDFIYTHIKNMRKKLIQGGCKDYLTSVYGIGYKFLNE